MGVHFSDRPSARLSPALAAALLTLAAMGVGSTAGLAVGGASLGGGEEREARLRAMQEEIVRLRAEMETLGQQERGLLGEVARLAALVRLRDREADEASLRLENVRTGLEGRRQRIAALEAAQAERQRVLVARLREIYKHGSDIEVRRLLGGVAAEAYVEGLRYASFLNERDARVLRSWNDDGIRLRAESEALAAQERDLERVRGEAVRARKDVERSRAGQSALLEGIRVDREKHREAIDDLERASRDLGRLVDSIEGASREQALDARKFRGMMEWPAEGKVSGAFGDSVHPRFRTVVPHPGLDIDAAEGESFRSVFDGRVVFASWLHGYGLTVIVDHGNGVVSVYAHASILLASAGEQVVRGQVLGKVGDTGSLRGAYLYFEMRRDGKPTDPYEWLHRR